MTYFFYQKGVGGRWYPAKSVGKPAKKGVNGQFSETRRIVELPPEEENWSLNELARKYSISEKNNGTTS